MDNTDGHKQSYLLFELWVQLTCPNSLPDEMSFNFCKFS